MFLKKFISKDVEKLVFQMEDIYLLLPTQILFRFTNSIQEKIHLIIYLEDIQAKLKLLLGMEMIKDFIQEEVTA